MDIIDFFDALYQIALIILCCVSFVIGAGRGRYYWCSKQAKKNNASTLLPPLSEARRVSENISSFLFHVMERNSKYLNDLRICTGKDQWLVKDILTGSSIMFHRLVQLMLALGLELKIEYHCSDDIEGCDLYSRPKGDLTVEEEEKLRISNNQIDIDNFRLF